MTDHEFVSLDGEAVTLPSGIDILSVMCAANSREKVGELEKWSYPGLHTCEVLQWMIDLNEIPNRKFVMFGFGWDINMLLVDINEQALKALKKTKRCFISCDDGTGMSFCIEHLARKIFTVSKGFEHRKDGRCYKFEIAYYPKSDRKQWMQIYDTWGFFQSSFVKALADWMIASKEQLQQIAEMKALRGQFEKIDKEEVKAYNLSECIMLSKMMETVDDKMSTGLGIKLTRFHGAGAVAGKLLEKYHARDYLPGCEHHSLLYSYFGGRIQTLRLGHFSNVYSYDIRSAYPSIMSQLPKFKKEKIRQVNEIGPWDVCKVKWDIPNMCPITPFPFRLKDSSIQFYRRGEGYYHSSEVLAALEMFPKNIEIQEIWRIPYDESEKPFQWIVELYEYRKLVRKAGDLAHIAIKLGLNALYGKTAQKQGYRNQEPPYRSFMVAGATTAGTRALLLRAANQIPESIIMFATDGIATTSKLDLPLGEDLGEWEEDFAEELRVYQAGLYVYDKHGELKQKTRSILPFGYGATSEEEARETRKRQWNEIAEIWNQEGTAALLHFEERHFITYGVASQNLPWRQWVKRPKTISLYPNKGHPYPLPDGSCILQPLYGPGGMSHLYAGRLDEDEKEEV